MRARFGLSISRFDVLAALDRAGDAGLTAGALTSHLKVTEGNTTQVTAPLIKDGLVRRTVSREDGRVAIFQLTRRGQRLFDEMAAINRTLGVRGFLAALRGAGGDPAYALAYAEPPRERIRRGSGMNPETFAPKHFVWEFAAGVARITLSRPERKNPLTFESYAELRDAFRALVYAKAVKAVVFGSMGGNFCSGGDVHEIIAPLTKMTAPQLLDFTRMTGDLVKAMRACPQPIVAAVDGVCAGAGAIIAMASDIRYASPDAKTAFLFNRVGLAGSDMGACAILPRIIGHGRASELLFFGRAMSAEEGKAWGFFNDVVPADTLDAHAMEAAKRLANGPAFANGITKNQLNMEWNMSLDTAIEAEAQAQALCMQTKDFERAYTAFAAKQKPVFEGD